MQKVTLMLVNCTQKNDIHVLEKFNKEHALYMIHMSHNVSNLSEKSN